ncbi:MAG: cupin domain-containing protein [Flammeovirgaceae bacterium]
MNKYKINFSRLPWNSKLGSKSKAARLGEMKMRLVEFNDQFVETDWCVRGHFGYVLEGRLFVHFAREILEFNAGDGLHIPAGFPHKHKAMIRKGEHAKLILFEEDE